MYIYVKKKKKKKKKRTGNENLKDRVRCWNGW